MILAAHFGSIPPRDRGGERLRSRSVGNEALLQRRTIHIQISGGSGKSSGQPQ